MTQSETLKATAADAELVRAAGTLRAAGAARAKAYRDHYADPVEQVRLHLFEAERALAKLRAAVHELIGE